MSMRTPRQSWADLVDDDGQTITLFMETPEAKVDKDNPDAPAAKTEYINPAKTARILYIQQRLEEMKAADMCYMAVYSDWQAELATLLIHKDKRKRKSKAKKTITLDVEASDVTSTMPSHSSNNKRRPAQCGASEP